MAQKIYTDLEVKGTVSTTDAEIKVGSTVLQVPQDVNGSMTIPTDARILELAATIEANQFLIQGQYGNTADEVLKAYAFAPSPKDGDTAVVKIPLLEGEVENQRYSYTAYVYDNSIEPAEGETKWVAMDGNYSASNVYFTDNIQMAGNFESVGNIERKDTAGNSKVLELKGTSLSSLISSIFQQELPGTTVWPSFKLSTSTKTPQEVGTDVAVNFSITPNAGSYTYGPATKVEWSNFKTTLTNGDTSETLTGTSGTFQTIKLTDAHITKGLSFSATGDHSAGEAPVTNLGNPSTTEQITARTNITPATSPSAIKAYRAWFYGYKTEENALDVTALTSDNIRGLSSGAKNITTFPGTMSTTNMKQMFWACPTTSVGTKKLEVVGQPAPRTVYTTTVDVNDASGGNPIEYTVFYVNAGSANEGSENFTVTFA